MSKIYPIKGASFYGVTKAGEVWSRKPHYKNPGGGWRQLQPLRTEDGHARVSIYFDDRRTKTIFIHILVLETFVGPCPKGKESSHIDGDGMNNRLENLCWKTHQENMADQWEHGTMSCGSKHPGAKMTEEKVKQALLRARQGETIASLAREYGIAAQRMNSIIRGKAWKHVHV